jgi:hypothetical protein
LEEARKKLTELARESARIKESEKRIRRWVTSRASWAPSI